MLISDLAQLLRIKAREAPAFMLERLVRESAREFFRKSRAWRVDFSGAITAGSNAYSFTQPTGTLVHDIIYAKLQTSNTNLAYLRDAGKAYVTPDFESGSTDSKYVTLVDNDTFELLPTPTADDIVTMKIVLSITRTATEIDDAIVDEFEDAILDGALYRLYEMPQESWSDIKLSQYHLNKFLSRTADAKLRAEETRTPGTRIAAFSW